MRGIAERDSSARGGESGDADRTPTRLPGDAVTQRVGNWRSPRNTARRGCCEPAPHAPQLELQPMHQPADGDCRSGHGPSLPNQGPAPIGSARGTPADPAHPRPRSPRSPSAIGLFPAGLDAVQSKGRERMRGTPMRKIISTLVFVALAAAAAPPALAADTVAVRAISAQTYEGTIEAGGDAHVFLLEDFAPQRFSVTLKAAKGSTLVPDLRLENPSNADVTAALAPFRIDRSRSVVVRNSDALSTPGTWRLRVGGKSGSTGSYSLKVTAKVLRVYRGTGSVPGVPTIGFFAHTASTVSLRATPRRGSALDPVLSAVAPPPCVSAELVPGRRSGTATMNAPWSGQYAV